MEPFDFTHGFKIGDYIAAYHAGYHQITKGERRFVDKKYFETSSDRTQKIGNEYNALIHYKKLYNENGTVCKGEKQNCCDVAFCRVASAHINNEITELLEKIENLKNIKEVIDNERK